MYRKDEVNIASVRHHQQLYVNMSQKYLFLPVCRTIAKLFCCVRLVVLVVAGMAGVLGDASSAFKNSQQGQLLSAANMKFALDLYKRFTSPSGRNVFMSPLRISTALTMTYLGARGQTRS